MYELAVNCAVKQAIIGHVGRAHCRRRADLGGRGKVKVNDLLDRHGAFSSLLLLSTIIIT